MSTRARRDSETVSLRRQNILALLPVQAERALSAEELRSKLDPNYACSLRNLQRDLELLEDSEEVASIQGGKPYRYYRLHVSRSTARLSEEESLSLLMARQFLSKLMPSGLFDALEPLYEKARATLSKTDYERWMNSVRWVSETQPLLPPEIKASVRQAVEEALLRGKQLQLRYLNRNDTDPKTYNAHPLGLVAKGPRLYLIATLRDYLDFRHLAVHRILSATVLNERADRPATFNIDRYLDSTVELGISIGPEIELHAVFSNKAGNHLFDSPLTKNDQLRFLDDAAETVELRTKVRQTKQLLWWLRGFGSDVQITAPTALQNVLDGEVK